MNEQTQKTKEERKQALTLALIATGGSIIVAAVTIIPSLTGEKKPNTSTTTTATGSSNVAVTGDHATISINSNDKLVEIIKERIPITDRPVVDLSKPMEQQVQLFPEDQVRIVGHSDHITQVWFGGHQWHSFDFGRAYTVWGDAGESVTPKFESPNGIGMVKLEISYTRYLDRPRDLRGSSSP